MSDRQSLIVRALPASDLRVEGAAPLPPSGFTQVEAAPLGVFRGEEIVWVASFARAELRALGRTIARAVLLGPPLLIDQGRGDDRLLERCYRTVLDYLFAGSRPANVLVVELRDGEQNHVDMLWRLALALDGRLTIRERADRVRLELFVPGAGGELAGLIAARPHALVRAMVSNASALFRKRERGERQTLAILALDLAEPVAPVSAAVHVQFTELSAEEVRRHPRKFGVGLAAAADGLRDRHQFVGRVEGRVIFRIACQRSAPVIELLSTHIRQRLADPVALLTEAYTEPELRNRSIFAAALHWSAEWARQRRIRTLVMLILPENTPSLRGAEKAGFRRVGELTVLR